MTHKTQPPAYGFKELGDIDAQKYQVRKDMAEGAITLIIGSALVLIILIAITF